jgi:hypothetical protein
MAVADDATSCPAADDVDPADLFGDCGSTIRAVVGEGTLSAGGIGFGGDTGGQICCYSVRETMSTCDYGRPYLEDGAARVAPVTRSRGWSRRSRPSVEGLSPRARAALATRWTRAALDEHAAIAAFSRVSLDLLAAGAPAALVDATHRAARDEVRHARLGFALASTYAGETVAPGAFPFTQALSPSGDLVALAVATTREGCIGETVSTLLALEAARLARDPAVRATLATIARDETRHAALAWRTVRWAMQRGGAPVREAVAAVFAEVAREGVAVPPPLGPSADFDDAAILEPHGLLGRARTLAVADDALRRVILPCAQGLLGGAGPLRVALGAAWDTQPGA